MSGTEKLATKARAGNVQDMTAGEWVKVAEASGHLKGMRHNKHYVLESDTGFTAVIPNHGPTYVPPNGTQRSILKAFLLCKFLIIALVFAGILYGICQIGVL